ncbi:iron complex transport system substrate-binding protein [Thermocatellispora tengchongensis]|uniref:Iron complex transport system substrate-binding protein n=1 Tax=Thermocatellispora tengchongensis TaxID=1073253 RepID=A0A840PB63_9ACTN|nr:ABC transporter substrate-binding protein [Thermocatellispora tengchongensis]MBB5136482.1 iron complex transport system substrate-binding protein [Thermocatellispora tengchongensis]
MTGLPRRGFLTGALGGAALLALAACGDGGGGGSETGASAGTSASPAARPLEFTDDRGKKISLPAAPTRVVAQSASAAALWDFGFQVIAVFGPSKRPDGSRDPEVGAVDIAKVESLGNVWGEFNVEKYASLQPELLVTGMYNSGELWYVPEKALSQVETLAPTVGVQLSGRPLTTTIEKYAELAAALGADLDAPAVADAKTRFEAATKELERITAEKKDIKVSVVSASPETLYVTYSPDHPDLTYFKEHGLTLSEPDKPGEGGFWEPLSWENADKYPADVILYDARTQAMTPEQMRAKPTWAGLPAVKAGQIYPWHAAERYSYLGYAQVLEELNANLAKARKIV